MPTMGKRVAAHHDVADAGEQPPPDRAARMRTGEVLDRKAARVEQRDRERIAERQHRRRARRGREAQRAGFGVDGGVDVHVGRLRERRLLVARQRDDLRALPLEMRRQQHELVGLAGIRQHHHDIRRRDHAEVAVRGFRRVDEEGRRARRRERGRELARDVTGLADAGHDHPAVAMEDEVDGGDEIGAEPRGEPDDRIGFGRENVAREREHVRRIDLEAGGRGGQRQGR